MEITYAFVVVKLLGALLCIHGTKSPYRTYWLITWLVSLMLAFVKS